MGFSANFVRAVRKRVDGDEVLFVEGMSVEDDGANGHDPAWSALKLEDVQSMYLTVLGSNGDGDVRLGGPVTDVRGTTDWSIALARHRADHPRLPDVGERIQVAGVTTFAGLQDVFCWSNDLVVGDPERAGLPVAGEG
jgi:hypothetical protein